ncbi:MAG TPA: formimidoylglutamate deiminase [Burkholderiales bacterium]|nr:formimidoylglutamate deiminase [Burkholderiales bacterium]
MKRYLARDALLPEGWAKDVVISVERGDIVAVSRSSSEGEALAGPVLPGMANLHSHAFQRGMAGLAEVRAHLGNEVQDDFWTWRELMYRFVERITPEQAQAIALHLYIEMLKQGYTAVAEFHYVHDPKELLARHREAAREAGIAITLLPSLYRWANFGSQPLAPRQLRFDTRPAEVLALYQDVERSPDVNAGIAPHSLRAVDPAALKELIAGVDAASPIHIHAAEQTREVEDCKAALGRRPVEWLLENCKLDARWCVVHATHVIKEEAAGLAASGATAGLCPSTEANLGDGIFPLLDYRGAGGGWGIGGDSHVSRDPAEELRLLEYVQRLTARKRNLIVGKQSSAVGTTLWLEAAAGGAKALGRRMGAIAPGQRADLVVLDSGHVDIHGRRGDAIANALVFSGSSGLVRDVMVGGTWVVAERRHAAEDAAAEAYKRSVKQLLA